MLCWFLYLSLSRSLSFRLLLYATHASEKNQRATTQALERSKPRTLNWPR